MALKSILKHKKAEIRAQKKLFPLSRLRQCIRKIKSRPKNFYAALSKKQGGARLICEVKKASPSQGVIRSNFNPKAITKSFNRGGAAAISVLTDSKFFQGSVQVLATVKKFTNLPVLRKDFIIDPYQVFESRLIGADCILLIVAALPEKKLRLLFKIARRLGLSVLVEVHNERELNVAIRAGARLVGINNRNLKTLKVNADHGIKLLKKMPANITCVIESGIETPHQIRRYTNAGADAFLIGTTLMKSRNIAQKLRSLKSTYGKS